jgi:signal transduction histidine kinase
VLGLLNLAKEDEHPRHPSLDDYLNMMEKSVLKLDETLKEILDYSRNARLEITTTRLDMEDLVNDCIDKLAFLNGFDKIVVRKEFSGSNIPLYGDAYRLSMIMVNLLSNAIKYRDKNKQQSYVDIKTKITPQTLTLIFEDNGIGIQESVTTKIFNMFFRGTERSEGAGLGLYIVKQTLDKLGGNITVTARLGTGTTFTVSIPNYKSEKGN